MGRPFLFYDSSKTTSSPPTTRIPARIAMRSALVSDCVLGALEIIDLAQLLHNQTGLARASYIEFSSCRAALLVIVAQSLNESSGRLRSALAQGMRLIKTMAVGCESTKSELSVIEALESAVRRLNALGAAEVETRRSVSGYDSYKDWMMSARNSSSSAEPRSTSEAAVQISGNQDARTGAPKATPQMAGFDIGDFLATFPQEADDFLTLASLNDEWSPLLTNPEVESRV